MKFTKSSLFWIISFTWGSIMTVIGFVAALFLMISAHKPKRFHYNVYFEIGDGWGGVELGAFFIVQKNSSLQTKQHEAGHSLQNLMFGPIMPFLVCIPSAIRYWSRREAIRKKKKTYADMPPYDAIWFEGMATRLGEKYFPDENLVSCESSVE